MDEKVKIKVEKFLQNLKKIFGERIKSCVLYGSCVKGNYREGLSDINVIVVLDRFERRDIYQVRNKVSRYARKNFIRPFFFSEWFLLSSSDVFPVEWLDIKENHIIFYGDDIINKVNIKKENLRLEIERKLKQLYLDFQISLVFEKENIQLLGEIFKNLRFLIPLIERQFGEGVDIPETLKNFEERRRFNKGEIEQISEVLLKLFEGLILKIDRTDKNGGEI